MQQFPFSIIDLTHPLQHQMPLWPGDPAITRNLHAEHHTSGYALNAWTMGEHTGTHVGAPSHRAPDGLSVNEIPVEDLVLPLRVVDTTEALTVVDLEQYEADRGMIEPGSCVALHTEWSDRWIDPERVFEQIDGVGYLWTGFTPKAVEWLHRERRVKVLATDAPDIGIGSDLSLTSGRKCAELGMLHLENLNNLDQMPNIGGFVVIGVLPLVGGTGSPARVLGLIQSK
jgi:kynurenine formamidase